MSTSTTSIEYFDALEASQATLEAFHQLASVIEKEELPDDPPAPLEERVSELLHVPEYRKNHRWLIWNERHDRVIASSTLQLRYTEDNRDMGWFFVQVLPEFRRRGLATQLMVPILEEAVAEERTKLSAFTAKDGPGDGFMAALGADAKQDERMSRLYVKDVDPDLMRHWIDRAPERAADYRLLSWTGPVPDDDLVRFAAHRSVMNTAPRDDFEMEDEEVTPERQRQAEKAWESQELTWWTMCAEHIPTRQLAGYTEVFFPKYRDYMAWQGDTGVDPDHRNKGLGSWLKAAMIVRLMDERPTVDRVDTWNAWSNAAMVGINEAMGYRVAKSYTAWQASTATISEKVEKLISR